MADLAALQVQLELQTAQFTEQMKTVNGQLDKLNNKVDSVGNNFKKLAAGLAGVFSVGVIITAIRNTIDAMDDLRDSAQKVGVSVESLSQLQFAAKQSGLGVEELNTGLGKLNKTLVDVEKGTTDAAKVMRAFGVRAGDTTEEALKKIATGFQQLPQGAAKTAAALAIFGKSGAAWVPMLNEGAEGIETLMKRFDELGGTVTKESADMADAFNDAMGEIDVSLGSITKELTAGLLPAVAGIAKVFADAQSTGEGWKKFGEGLGEVLKWLAKVAIEVWGAFEDIGKSIAAVTAAAAAAARFNFAGAREILRQWDEDSKQLASDIERRKKAIDAIGTSVAGAGEKAGKAGTNLKLLKDVVGALGTESDKTEKKVKKILTPVEQLEADLKKMGEQRVGALAQLEALGKVKPEQLEKWGVSAQQFAEAQERIMKTAGVWTVLDQAMSNIAKNKQAIADMSTAWDTLVERLTAKKITAEEFEEIAKQLQKLAPPIDDASKAANDFDKSIAKMGESVTLAIATNAGNAMNDFIDNIGEAKFSFSDMITSMLKDIAKLITQLLIVKPLMNSITGMFGGGAAATPGAAPAFVAPAFIPAVPMLGATAFNAGTQQAAGGGGTPGGNGLSVSSGVQVNVYNNADVEVSTKESQGADGTQVIDMYIDRRMNERFSNGSMDKIMRTNFGVMRNAGG